MKLHQLKDAPPPALAEALDRFEQQFTYPLGPGRSFRISHGADYPRFFRAIGDAACFVAERDGQVAGVLGAAIRDFLAPSGEPVRAAYLGDLKVDPAMRGGRVLPALASAALEWAKPRVTAAFAVVMDGTPVTPTRYTGRLGVPQFSELARIAVLRLMSAKGEPILMDSLTGDAAGSDGYRRLSRGRYACPGGSPPERSEIQPGWLMSPDGNACGRLEDTRRAKRLITNDGVEMMSAHLSCFAYTTIDAGAELSRHAMLLARELGLPALFVAVPRSEAEAFRRALSDVEIIDAPATVYGVGFEPGRLWNINTAEI